MDKQRLGRKRFACGHSAPSARVGPTCVRSPQFHRRCFVWTNAGIRTSSAFGRAFAFTTKLHIHKLARAMKYAACTIGLALAVAAMVVIFISGAAVASRRKTIAGMAAAASDVPVTGASARDVAEVRSPPTPFARNVWRGDLIPNAQDPGADIAFGAVSSDIRKHRAEKFDNATAHYDFLQRIRRVRTSEEGPLVHQTVIISGANCTSRLNETLTQLAAWLRLGDVYHLRAVWRPNGAEGCMQSHIAALKFAMHTGKNTLVVEDDFDVACSDSKWESAQRLLVETVGPDRWDMFIAALFAHDWAKVAGAPPLMRIFRTTTTGGYIVNHSYAQVLHDLWSDVHADVSRHRERSWNVGVTEIDQNWATLSRADRWYSTSQSCGHQRPCVTTIAGGFADNRWEPDESLKSFWYRGGGDEVKQYPIRLRKDVTIMRVLILVMCDDEHEQQRTRIDVSNEAAPTSAARIDACTVQSAADLILPDHNVQQHLISTTDDVRVPVRFRGTVCLTTRAGLNSLALHCSSAALRSFVSQASKTPAKVMFDYGAPLYAGNVDAMRKIVPSILQHIRTAGAAASTVSAMRKAAKLYACATSSAPLIPGTEHA